jgi:hypothetical protein
VRQPQQLQHTPRFAHAARAPTRGRRLSRRYLGSIVIVITMAADPAAPQLTGRPSQLLGAQGTY